MVKRRDQHLVGNHENLRLVLLGVALFPDLRTSETAAGVDGGCRYLQCGGELDDVRVCNDNSLIYIINPTRPCGFHWQRSAPRHTPVVGRRRAEHLNHRRQKWFETAAIFIVQLRNGSTIAGAVVAAGTTAEGSA